MADGKFLIGKPAGGVTTVTMTDGVGNTNLVLPESGTVATTAYVDGKMVLGTAVNATGTSIDFTGIPSWVKKITVMFNSISTNGASNPIIRVGSGTFATTGYVSSGTNLDPGLVVNASGSTAGLQLCSAAGATVIFGGNIVLTLLGSNTWVSCGTIARADNSGSMFLNSGYVTLSGTLDRIRLTTVNGTDTFDAGSINIMYEG